MQLKDRGAWSRVLVWINPKDNLLRSAPFANCGYIQIPATIVGHVPNIRLNSAIDTLLVWKRGDKAVADCRPLGLSSINAHIIAETAAYARGYVSCRWVNNALECEDIPVGTLQWVSSPDGTRYPYVGQASTQTILSCKVCGTFSEYAAPNQADQVSFICYSCRR
jgi:hypothetical protein